MAHRLDGCNAKLNRAHKHLDALNAKTASFAETDPCTFMRKREPNGPKQVFRLKVLREPDPDGTLATLIGDLAHNLRSALNHLAWELKGHYKLPQDRAVDFPIFESKVLYWDRGSRDSRVGNLPATALALIDGVQPCNGGDYSLWVLHEVNRVDKHQTIPTVALGIAERVDTGPLITVEGGVLVDSHMDFGDELVEDDTEVGWAITDPPEAEAKMHGRFTARVAFDSAGTGLDIPDKTLVAELVEAGARVEWLVNRFGRVI